jgi:uncharacterized protein (TIGR03663 family)
MLPYGFRPWLGRLGALASSVMILISPAILHYSRHLRHDIFNAVFTVLMFLALFHFLLAWQNGDEKKKRRWLYIGAGVVALTLATKELAFIHGFVGVTFIGVISLMEGLGVRQRRGLFWLGLGLLVVVGGMVLWLAIGNAGMLAAGEAPGLARQVVDGLAGMLGGMSHQPDVTHEVLVKSAWKLLQLLMLLVGLFFGVSTLGLSVENGGKDSGLRLREVVRSISLQQLGLAVLLGVIIFVVLYTTFFTNPYGVVSGTWGALSYWLSQQDVQRGSQPWYYYLMLVPLYEFLPLLVGAVGGAWYLIRRLQLTGAEMQAGRTGTSHKGSPLGRYFVGLVLYWVIANFFIYSWAGEKMPWLTVHLALPLIFLAGWTIDRGLGQVDWGAVRERGGLLFAGLVVLSGAAVLGLLRVQPFQGQSLFDLRDTGQWLGTLLIAGLLVYLVVHFGKRLGGYLASRVVLVVGLVVLSLLTFRSAWLVSFINYDNVSEYLFYAHAAPDTSMAMEQIEDLSRRTVGDKMLKVAYDNESTWPLEWYFREYPNRAYYGDSPNRDQLDAPVVIVGANNESKVTPFLGERYQRFNYRLVWWPLETYKEQTPLKMWHTYVAPDMSNRLDGDRAAAMEEIRQKRRELWGVLFYHRHATPKNEWPYVHRFYMYVRKDVLNQLWDYQIGAPLVVEAEEDEYASGRWEVAAVRAVGNQGMGQGQFQTPRAVAIGPDGLWYVADSGNNRIEVLDGEGNFVRSWGEGGSGAGQLQEPWGIAVNEEGRVYVADTWNHRVQVFDREGNYEFQWGTFADVQGRAEEQPGLFWGPRDIRVDADGNVWVTDTGNKRIQKFTGGGEFLGMWGGGGIIPGRFEEPTSLDIGPDGNIYVADTWNRRVQVFSSDFTPLREWPVQAWESQSVVNKPFIRVDSQGKVYVSDPEGYRVLVFNGEDGSYLYSIGEYGFDTGAFALPLGMALDADDHLVVVDSDNNRLLEFALESMGQAD